MSKKSMPVNPNPDKQATMTGKGDNDFNKIGNQKPTQKNEGRRTPKSRKDRETHLGGDNQIQARRGAAGIGH